MSLTGKSVKKRSGEVEQNTLCGKIHVGFYAVISATRVFLIVFVLLCVLHFLAPSDSIAGKALIEFTRSPNAVTGLIYTITGLAIVYYYRFGSSIALVIQDGSIALHSGNFIRKTVLLDKSHINHINIERTVFERIYSLGSLKVFTPGSHKPTLVLPNLHVSSLEALRRMLQMGQG